MNIGQRLSLPYFFSQPKINLLPLKQVGLFLIMKNKYLICALSICGKLLVNTFCKLLKTTIYGGVRYDTFYTLSFS